MSTWKQLKDLFTSDEAVSVILKKEWAVLLEKTSPCIPFFPTN
jgi:hypothetical protein